MIEELQILEVSDNNSTITKPILIGDTSGVGIQIDAPMGTYTVQISLDGIDYIDYTYNDLDKIQIKAGEPHFIELEHINARYVRLKASVNITTAIIKFSRILRAL